MTEDDDYFLKYLKGVKPISKDDIITKPIQKHKTQTKKKKNENKSDKTLKKEFKKPNKTIKKLNIEINTTNKKLKRGQIPINKKIDLHGCSVDEAKSIFVNTVNDCFYNNKRCLLFITGKGSRQKLEDNPSESRLYYGKIRSNLLNWIKIDEIQSKILNVEQASIKYGGDGAYFIYLRKHKN